MTLSFDIRCALLAIAERLVRDEARRVVLESLDEDIFDRSVDAWCDLGLKPIQAQALVEGLHDEGLAKRVEGLDARNIRLLHFGEAVFPYTLPQGASLPPILFFQGRAEGWRRAGLAIVGTRKPSAYGRESATAIAREAALRGIPVISGAATGIDTCAHEGCLKYGGLTVAVLGCGLDHVYPRQAGPLYERIAENGALVSQFAPSVPPDRKRFPMRNHVIAALSETVVVVEGAAGSGARYTAQAARKLGLRLMALPGDISRPQAVLPNRLLAEGAEIIIDPAAPVDPLARKSAQQASFDWKGPTAAQKTGAGVEAARLSELERNLAALIAEGSGSADDLLAAGLAAPGAVNEALLRMELVGVVRQEPGRRYALATAERGFGGLNERE